MNVLFQTKDELPYACTECDKRFAQKTNLRNHLRTVCASLWCMRSLWNFLQHSSDQPFECDTCHKRCCLACIVVLTFVCLCAGSTASGI